MKTIRDFLLAAALCGAFLARAGDFTDLWWNPAESGWGMNLVHQGETSFATLFVYGPDSQPTWYSASDARVYAYGSGGLPHFSGPLFRTTGPWHAGPFDPRNVGFAQVGSISIDPVAKDRVRVTYVVNGQSRTVELVRASLAQPQPASFYHATLSLRESLPGQPAYGVARYNGELTFEIEAGRATLRFDDQLGRRCTYSGNYAQAGKLASVSGEFTCTAFQAAPRTGTFTLEDLEVTAHGVTGMLRTMATDRLEAGRLAAGRF